MRKLLFLAGAIVFVDTMFFAALTPLLPGYADDFHLSKAGAGVLAAAYPAGALLAAVPSGLAVNRLGARKTLVGGLALIAGSTVLFSFAESILLLDLARFGQGVASGFAWTAALSWLVAAAPAERRGELIGSAMAAAIVGALFGPVLGGIASLAGTSVTFASTAALTLVLAIWALAMPAPPRAERQSLGALVSAGRDPRVLRAVWFVTLPALLFSTMGVLGPLRLDALGVGAVVIGAIWLTAAAIEAVMSPLIGRLSDRIGRLAPIRIGLVGSAVVAAALPWPGTAWLLGVLIVLGGIAFGTFWAPAMSLLADEAEQRGLDYGYAFALINLAWAPGQALGASGGGALARATSDAVPYLLLAAICVGTYALVRRAREGRPEAVSVGASG